MDSIFISNPKIIAPLGETHESIFKKFLLGKPRLKICSHDQSYRISTDTITATDATERCLQLLKKLMDRIYVTLTPQTNNAEILIAIILPTAASCRGISTDPNLWHDYLTMDYDFPPFVRLKFIHGDLSGLFHLPYLYDELYSRSIHSIIVCGVDSWNDQPSMRYFEQSYPLLKATQHEGIIPGEAAACVTFTRKPQGPCFSKLIDYTIIQTGSREAPEAFSHALRQLLSGYLIKNPQSLVLLTNKASTQIDEILWHKSKGHLWKTDRTPDEFHTTFSFGEMGAATLPVMMSLAYLLHESTAIDDKPIIGVDFSKYSLSGAFCLTKTRSPHDTTQRSKPFSLLH